MILCHNCNARPKKDHGNSKWCSICAKQLIKRPRGTLTKRQIKKATSLIGKKPITEISEEMGVSVSNIRRSCRGTSFWYKNGKYKNRPDLTRKVLDFYFRHGKIKTQKAFPEVNVKCIIDRPEYYGVKKVYRQIRWTERQKIEAARMAGLVSFVHQAQHFNRPGAHAGSIKSLWAKSFMSAEAQIHGMPWNHAKLLSSPGCPTIKARTLKLCLWVDLEKHLRPDVPDFIANAIRTLAGFQRWLYQHQNPRPKILKMIRMRRSQDNPQRAKDNQIERIGGEK